MDYNVDVNTREGYVEATLTGVRTPAAFTGAAEHVTTICDRVKIFRVLIDVRQMSGQLDTVQTFEVAGHEIPQQPHTRQLARSAILDLPENLERIRFFETVAVNRGINVRVFDDEKLAVEWLLA